MQRFFRKADDAVNRKIHHFPERVFGLARCSRRTCERYLGLLESHPPEHAPDKAVMFGHVLEGLHGLAADQAEVTDVAWYVDRRQPFQKSIEEASRKTLEPGFTLPAEAPAIYDLESFLPFCHQVENDLWRI